MTNRAARKTTEEKLAILKEAAQNGIVNTCEKYGIYPTTYYKWKEKYDTMGEEGFSHGMTPDQLREIRRLRKENQHLKDMLIEKELESRMKDELIKKKYQTPRKFN
ncbi:MAG TPA: transposase [Chitinophagaceae bacterium]|nr:transposase [Chitinophagaceae bacterium]